MITESNKASSHTQTATPNRALENKEENKTPDIGTSLNQVYEYGVEKLYYKLKLKLSTFLLNNRRGMKLLI